VPTGHYPRIKSLTCKECGNPREEGSPYVLCKPCKKRKLKINTDKHLAKKRSSLGEPAFLLARQLSVLKWRGVRLTEQEYRALLQSQSGCCAICGDSDPKGQGNWHVDHCHKTGNIRGLLCTTCNLMLGYAKDSIIRLQSGIDYLNKFTLSRVSDPSLTGP
jgi:hypothetical protein